MRMLNLYKVTKQTEPYPGGMPYKATYTVAASSVTQAESAVNDRYKAWSEQTTMIEGIGEVLIAD